MQKINQQTFVPGGEKAGFETPESSKSRVDGSGRSHHETQWDCRCWGLETMGWISTFPNGKAENQDLEGTGDQERMKKGHKMVVLPTWQEPVHSTAHLAGGSPQDAHM